MQNGVRQAGPKGSNEGTGTPRGSNGEQGETGKRGEKQTRLRQGLGRRQRLPPSPWGLWRTSWSPRWRIRRRPGAAGLNVNGIPPPLRRCSGQAVRGASTARGGAQTRPPPPPPARRGMGGGAKISGEGGGGVSFCCTKSCGGSWPKKWTLRNKRLTFADLGVYSS